MFPNAKIVTLKYKLTMMFLYWESLLLSFFESDDISVLSTASIS